MEASPRRSEEFAAPGFGWGVMAGTLAALLVIWIASRVNLPVVHVRPEEMWTTLLFWGLLAPLHILIGSLSGGLAGTACCAVAVHHARLAAVGGGVTAALLMTGWLQTLL
jgi:TRAP-type C4-dicarboxylate transport system permease large subunit